MTLQQSKSPSYITLAKFPYYRVGDDGTVWTRLIRKCGNRPRSTATTWQQINPVLAGKYYVVTLYRDDGPRQRFYVHDLVLRAFSGDPPSGQQCRHKDGYGTHNDLANLHWGTPLQNGQDKVQHGRHAKGVKNAGAKLTEVSVMEILQLHQAGAQGKDLAVQFSVGPSTISRIVRQTHWRHLSAKPQSSQEPLEP